MSDSTLIPESPDAEKAVAAVEAIANAAIEEAKRQGMVAFIVLAMMPDGATGATVTGCNPAAIADLVQQGPESLREYGRLARKHILAAGFAFAEMARGANG